MKRFIQVYLLIGCLLESGINANPLYGYEAQPARDNYPFVVSIGHYPAREAKDHFCTGTLISRNHVLTARHCFEDLKTYKPTKNRKYVRVTVGSSDNTKGTKYEIQEYETYEKWAERNDETPDDKLLHDVAVLELKGDAPSGIEPATITQLSHDEIHDRHAMTAGWGENDHNPKPIYLVKAKVRVIDITRAKLNLKLTKTPNNREINHVCTKDFPILALGSGDSGGPLFIKNKELIGVNSHAHPNFDMKYHINAFNSHQSVPYYRKYIESYVNKPSPSSR